MAIGYGKIIVKVFEGYYDDLLLDVGKSYRLFETDSKNIARINPDGDIVPIDEFEMKKIFFDCKNVVFKFQNQLQNSITLSLSLIDNYIVEENYWMDELLTDDEYSDLLSFVKQRFDGLLENKKAIGFIFDEEGYSEDYILIPPPNWQNSNECWRKLMGG